jgi:hypothetical protein
MRDGIESREHNMSEWIGIQEFFDTRRSVFVGGHD